MLDIRCPEEIEKTRKFAEEIGALEDFNKKLEHVETIATNLKADSVVITKDFADHGFCWAIMRRGECIYNGAMLFTPPGDWGGGPPNFSVNIEPASKPEWRLHS